MDELLVADLFCGAGGAARGIELACQDAGIAVTIIGVDNRPQPRYPYHFVLGEWNSLDLEGFDFVWASPPCQKYSFAAAKTRNKGKEYPDLLGIVADMLRAGSVPYCVENVVGSARHMTVTAMLCGSMFGLGVRRHRLFETPFTVPPLACVDCNAQNGLTDVTGHGPPKRWYRTCTVAGHGGDGPHFDYQTWKDAMDIQWMNKQELTQAVPPTYSRYIFTQWLCHRNALIRRHTSVTRGSSKD